MHCPLASALVATGVFVLSPSGARLDEKLEVVGCGQREYKTYAVAFSSINARFRADVLTRLEGLSTTIIGL
jgi:hypothetical protein